MFIHWGPASLTGQEISWSRANSNSNCPNHGPIPIEVYDNLYKKFNPVDFEAAEWVGLAKTAGMKYMLLTAKHHDGFLLWNSKVDAYNIGATPFRRDICAELADAARRNNMKLGWYFSPMEWRDPDCRSSNNGRFTLKIQAQLRELLSNYGKIDLLWFDTDGNCAVWDPANTYKLVKELQPQMLINNRLEMGGEDGWLHQNSLRINEDFATPEQRLGTYNDEIPWETCMTLGTQWSWKPGDKVRSAREIVGILARCVGADGNLLLNVGPMPHGPVEPRQVDILIEVGAWMDKHGESIYGTRGGPWKPGKNLSSTRKDNVIYLHVLRSKSPVIELPNIARVIKSASLLGGRKVEVEQKAGKVVVVLPSAVRDSLDTVVKLKLEGSAMDLPTIEAEPEIKITASNTFANQDSNYGPALAFDDDSTTRWATDQRQAWIAADLGTLRSIGAVRIQEAYPGRVLKFEFQYRNGSEWKTIFNGTTLGAHYEKTFEKVKAREFRLNILESAECPTITEIEILEE
jgi:alpha-L-fucosidase